MEALVILGSIPAGAGEPPTVGVMPAAFRVYPRWRGGTEYYKTQQQAPEGLSPLARGNLVDEGCCYMAPGSIPAGAGEPGVWTWW